MAVMTHAQIHTATARSVDFHDLSTNQRALVTNTLAELGIEDGYLADHDGHPDVTYRTALSAATAATIGLHLPDGHELARCADCDTLGSANDMRVCDDNAIRCTLGAPDTDATCLSTYEAH